MTIPDPNDISASQKGLGYLLSNQRLIMDHIILENFKSYAGRQVIGPFHPGFSAVVGPNGSGKSNVIDALLFVFGYRASKIRLPKASDLIHVSDAFPHLDNCCVSVHFKLISVDVNENCESEENESDLVISRVAYKSNKSDYLINGKASNFTEVIRTLKGYGIDLDHHRFLILQGEVENIALMKPKGSNDQEEGLLEFLEDIIGSNKYKPLIESSLHSLEQANQTANLKMATLRVIEKEKVSKEGKKEEAESYLRLENQIIAKKGLYFQVKQYEANLEKSEKEKALDLCKSTIHELKKNIKKNESELISLQDQDRAAQLELKDRQAKLSLEKKELSEVERQDAKLQETKKFIKGKLSKSNKSQTADKSQLIEKQSTLKSLLAEIEQKETALLEVNASLIPAEKELSKLRSNLSQKTEKFQNRVNDMQNQLTPYLEKDQKLTTKIALAESEIQILEKQLYQEDDLISDLENKLENLQNDISVKEQELHNNNRKLFEIEKESTSLQGDAEGLTSFKNNLEESIKDLRNQVMVGRIAVQEATSNTHQNRVLDALLNESGINDGIFGRLGDLCTYDSKYDAALQAAAGGYFDNILVDNTKTAERCVDYLKRSQLGRKTFIVLDKLMSASASAADLPGKRLVDLVHPVEPRFQPALYHALRDTLVANTLNEANQIAFGGKSRYRVVTLEGKLIDKSGAMTGGSAPTASVSKGNSGGAVVKASGNGINLSRKLKKDLEILEKDLSSKMLQLKDTNALQSECNSRLLILNNQKQALSVSLSKLENELLFLNNLKLELTQKIRTIKSNHSNTSMDTIKLKMNELNQAIVESSSEKQKIQEVMTKLQTKIKDEQENILEIGGITFRSLLSQVQGLKEQQESLSDRIEKLNATTSDIEKSISRLAQSVKGDSETTGLEQELSNIEKIISENTNKAVQLTSSIDNIQAELKEISSNSSLSKALSSLQKNQCELTRQMEEKETDLANLSSQLKSLNSSIAQLNLERNQLSLHDLCTEEDQAEKQNITLEPLTDQELSNIYNKKLLPKITREISTLEEDLSGRKPPFLGIIEEFRGLLKSLEVADREYSNAVAARDTFQKEYEGLRRQRFDEFMKGFQLISLKLKEMYQLITLGGNAELELVDSLDPFSEGVLFTVMPLKKSWKSIGNLSGGEKTLASLALVFALHEYKPCPFYVMDEIDAALDYRNVSIVAHYIAERTANVSGSLTYPPQFIVISLRDNMFELANLLIGIYKTHQCTASVTFNAKASILDN